MPKPQPPQLTFDEETFQLRLRHYLPNGILLNAYLRPDDAPERWERALILHRLPGPPDPNLRITQMRWTLKQNHPQAPATAVEITPQEEYALLYTLPRPELQAEELVAHRCFPEAGAAGRSRVYTFSERWYHHRTNRKPPLTGAEDRLNALRLLPKDLPLLEPGDRPPPPP